MPAFSWESATEWDNAQGENHVVHESYGDYSNADVQLGYPASVKSVTHHMPLYEDSTGVITDVVGAADGDTQGSPSMGNAGGPFNQTYVHLDGTNYISVDDSYASSTALPQLTVNCWYRSSTSTNGWAFLDYDRSEYFTCGFENDNDRIQFATNNGGIHDLYTSSGWADGVWHMVTFVYDGTDKYIYVDATQEASASNPHSGSALGSGNTRYGFIGIGSEASSYNGSTNGSGYTGDIAFVQWWEGTGLSASEVQDLYDYYKSGHLTTGKKTS